jgi:hypothetical protein
MIDRHKFVSRFLHIAQHGTIFHTSLTLIGSISKAVADGTAIKDQQFFTVMIPTEMVQEQHQYTALSPLPISLMRPKFHERTSSKKRSWGRTKNLSGTTFLMNKADRVLSWYAFPIYAPILLCYSTDDALTGSIL